MSLQVLIQHSVKSCGHEEVVSFVFPRPFFFLLVAFIKKVFDYSWKTLLIFLLFLRGMLLQKYCCAK